MESGCSLEAFECNLVDFENGVTWRRMRSRVNWRAILESGLTCEGDISVFISKVGLAESNNLSHSHISNTSSSNFFIFCSRLDTNSSERHFFSIICT